MKYKLLANTETHQIDIAYVNEENDGREVIGYIESEWGAGEIAYGFQREFVGRISNILSDVIEVYEDLETARKKLYVAMGK